MTTEQIIQLVDALSDDQLSALRYRAFELQDDMATSEEERNAAFRETLRLEALSLVDVFGPLSSSRSTEG